MTVKEQIKELSESFSGHVPSNAPLATHLKNLVHLNQEAAEGFRKAASLMESDQDELLFKTYADQRERFASVLKAFEEQERTDGDSSHDIPAIVRVAEDFAASAHRVWMSLVASVTNSKLQSMLKECMRGDETIIESYDAAVSASNSRSEVHNRLTSQRADIKAVHETLSRLTREATDKN